MFLYSDILIHPAVCAEANGVRDGEVETSVPMYYNKNIKHNLAYPEGVGEVSASLCLVEELSHTREPVERGGKGRCDVNLT